MKIVVFGTGPFCVPTFAALLDSPHEVPAVLTRPIGDAGQRRKTTANPVRDFAERHNVQVLDPLSCNAAPALRQLENLAADLFFVCDYGQFLSRKCLRIPRLGGINLHGSLLPRYRGSAPIQWAIHHGEQRTGATVIHMTPAMDAGPILATTELEIAAEETSEQLEPRLSRAGVAAVMQAIALLNDWDGVSPIGTIQDPALATRAPRLNKSDGQIDWDRSARQIVNQIRAFQPWPGTSCWWNHGKSPLRLIIHRASVMKVETDAPPGVIVVAEKKLLVVQTGEHALALDEVQPEGKKSMPIADFLRGQRIAVGQMMN